MSKSLIVLAGLAVMSAPALAQGLYADAGYQFINIGIEDSGDEADVDLGALIGHVGYSFNDWFAAEAEGAIGIEDESASFAGTTVSAELNYLIGAYGRVQVPAGPNINLYARAGIVQAELEASATGPGFNFSDSQSETGAGYGAGAEFFLTGNLGVRGDYTRYDIDDAEADAFTVALAFRF